MNEPLQELQPMVILSSWDERTFDEAVDLEMMRWLYSAGCPWDETMLQGVADRSDTDMRNLVQETLRVGIINP